MDFPCRCVPDAGAIAGVVIGTLAGVIIMCIGCCYCCRCCCFSYRNSPPYVDFNTTVYAGGSPPGLPVPRPYSGEYAQHYIVSSKFPATTTTTTSTNGSVISVTGAPGYTVNPMSYYSSRGDEHSGANICTYGHPIQLTRLA